MGIQDYMCYQYAFIYQINKTSLKFFFLRKIARIVRPRTFAHHCKIGASRVEKKEDNLYHWLFVELQAWKILSYIVNHPVQYFSFENQSTHQLLIWASSNKTFIKSVKLHKKDFILFKIIVSIFRSIYS